MWLLILKTFLDGSVKFHAGELRFVADEEAAMRFLGRNWASKAAAPAVDAAPAKKGEPVSLDIHKSTLGVKDTNHG